MKIIETLAIWIMRNRLKNAQKNQLKIKDPILIKAYGEMIKSYKNTIMFLESNIKGKFNMKKSRIS